MRRLRPLHHLVPGRLSASDIHKQIKAGGGVATIRTVQGEILTLAAEGDDLTVTDEQGGTAKVTIPDVYQKNGVIMVIDAVLMP